MFYMEDSYLCLSLLFLLSAFFDTSLGYNKQDDGRPGAVVSLRAAQSELEIHNCARKEHTLEERL